MSLFRHPPSPLQERRTSQPRASTSPPPPRTRKAAQVERLRYVLANGVKENLVERVCQWPGVHSAEALIHGTPLEGHWFDRTRQYAARNQGKELRREDHVFAESVVLSPISCWAHLPADRYRERVKALIEEIEEETAGRGNCRAPKSSAPRRSWPRTR